MQRRFLLNERIGHKTGYQIDKEIDRGTMSGMLYLTDIFQEIVDGFDNGSFAKQELILKVNQFVFHVFLQFCEKSNIFGVKLFE